MGFAADSKIPAYPTAEAKNHVGETASVVGVIQEVHTSNSGTEFLNFDGQYPDVPFSVVVFAADAAAVGDVARYEGKKVAVTGKITLFHEKPEIVIKSADALKAQ